MFVIGICGQPLSGKTTYINILVEKLGVDRCSLLNLENYKLNEKFIPDSYDFDKFIEDIDNNSKSIIIIEGNFIFCNIKLITKINFKIYIDTNEKPETTYITQRYSQNPFFITNSIPTFINPSKKYADIIIFSNNRYNISVELLSGYINNNLKINL
jgi:uridine kinase